MIKINFYKIEDVINKVEIKGHALQNKFGKDLVCAAVTGIVTSMLNAIDKIKNNACEFKINNGLVIINMIHNSDELQLMLNTLFYQLQTIYLQYDSYIDFKEVKL